MNWPAHSRYPFHVNGNAYRRDADAQPRFEVLGTARATEHGPADTVIVHEAGDRYTREVPVREIPDMVEHMDSEQAFALGLVLHDAELELEGAHDTAK